MYIYIIIFTYIYIYIYILSIYKYIGDELSSYTILARDIEILCNGQYLSQARATQMGKMGHKVKPRTSIRKISRNG